MSENINDVPVKDFKAEITSGDLLQLMTHAATREDIARLDSKIDSQKSELKADIMRLDSKIDTVAEKLDSKIDTVAEKLDSKIDTVAEKLDSKINTVAEKLDSTFKWLVGVVITGIIISPVSTALVIHFIK